MGGPAGPVSDRVRERLRYVLPGLISLVLFLVALEVLRVELHAVRWQDVTADIWGTPRRHLLAALLLTALNYIVLVGYDVVAFRYIGKHLSIFRIAAAASLAYAISHSVGFAMLSGASVRYRFYSRWGVSAEELSRIVFSYSMTFWLGLLTLGGVTAISSRLPPGVAPQWSAVLPWLGWIFLLAVAAYLASTAIRRTPLRVRSLVLPLPTPRIALEQWVVSIADWALAGAVLFVLLPDGAPPFLTFLGVFFLAVLVGMVSHVPGGVGVFEGLMVLLLGPYLTSGQVLPALVVYRAVYYLLPFVVGLVALVIDELHQRRESIARTGAWLGRVAEALTPRLLAVLTFLAGVVLLVSGATPAAPGRLDLLDRILPLGVVEVSHFVGSVTGAALLVLSHGLARRLDAAYYVTTILIAVGMTASLLKGFDYEEAVLLFGVLLVLRRSRPAFDRRAAFFGAQFSPGWFAAVAGALIASVWLGLFAFKHVEYSSELWWQFAFYGEASRFLRASVGGATVVILVGAARLIRPAPHAADTPNDEELAAAGRIVAAQSSTAANLVFLRDKAVLFDESRRGFVMYGVQGRTWLAMGDPVGPPDVLSDLVRAFLERCDDLGGVPAFYEVGPRHLHRYADFGLTFVKLGEEAKVELATFTLQGGQMSKLRQALRRLEKERATFRILEPSDVRDVMPQLRDVSDDWLAEKSAAEKGFSLGFFDEEYLRRFPVAVVERDGRILAFANLWVGAQQSEISLDLMRYRRDAPRDIMESLFVHMMTWARERGYQHFALGMAPLSGFEASPVASYWNRIGAFLFERGESVYNFQGLRAYKDKFNPIWEPRYLAYPGGLSLPRILADASALIAGGYRKILLK